MIKLGEKLETPFSYYGHLYLFDQLTSNDAAVTQSIFSQVEAGEGSIILAHDDDLDGITSVGAMYNILRSTYQKLIYDRIEEFAVPHHGDSTSKLLTILELAEERNKQLPTVVVVLDHQLRKVVLDKINEMSAPVIWIDHHPYSDLTVQCCAHNENLVFINSCFTTVEHCTASLVWSLGESLGYKPSDESTCLIGYVRFFDTGWTCDPEQNQEYSTEAEALNAYISHDDDNNSGLYLRGAKMKYRKALTPSFGDQDDGRDVLDFDHYNGILSILAEGRKILQFNRKVVDQVKIHKTKFALPVNDEETVEVDLAYAFHTGMKNDMCKKILSDRSVRVGMVFQCFVYDNKPVYRVSVFGRKTDAKLTVRYFANQYGGGGHHTASAFSLTLEQMAEFPLFK